MSARKVNLVTTRPYSVYRLDQNVLERIWLERLRQKQLLREGKIRFDVSQPENCNYRKMTILTEEHGEVAREVHEENKEKLRTELVQLVSVGIA